MRKSREDSIIMLAIEKFKEFNPDKQHVILRNETLRPYVFLKAGCRLEYIPNNILHETAMLSSDYIGGRGRGLLFSEIEGIFKLTLSYNKRQTIAVMYSYRLTIAGKDIFRTGMLISKAAEDIRLMNLIIKKSGDKATIEALIPPVGFNEIRADRTGVIKYKKFVPKQTNVILHPAKEEIRNALKMHFMYAKNHGEILKILIYGGFGTGKTECVAELLGELLKEHKEMNITYAASDLEILGVHMERCAKTKTRTAVVIEEAEHWLSNAGAKFFLGSHSEPKNKAGAVYIFITNNPDRINNGVITRDERVDMIIPFTKEGMLMEDRISLFNSTIAKQKTKPKIKWSVSDYSMLANLSGAEIIGLVKSTVRYCQLRNITEVTDAILLERKNQKRDLTEQAKRYNSDRNEEFKSKAGFGFRD